MELSVINDTIVATTQALGFHTGKLLLLRRQFYNPNSVSLISDTGSPETIAGGILLISAAVLPVDAMARPPLKSDSYRLAPRILARRTKRAPRRRSPLTGGGEEGSDDGSAGNNNDGPFGGGGGNGFNGDEGSAWDDGSSSSSDPAFDFVYEVISWIALSNCLHFAFKKVVRNLGNLMEDPSREKVPSFVRCSP